MYVDVCAQPSPAKAFRAVPHCVCVTPPHHGAFAALRCVALISCRPCLFHNVVPSTPSPPPPLRCCQPPIDAVIADWQHPLAPVLRELVQARLPSIVFTPLGATMPFADLPLQYSSRVSSTVVRGARARLCMRMCAWLRTRVVRCVAWTLRLLPCLCVRHARAVHARVPHSRTLQIVFGAGLTARDLTTSLLARVYNTVLGEVCRLHALPAIHTATADALERCAAPESTPTVAPGRGT
jgi:hypothetical protein